MHIRQGLTLALIVLSSPCAVAQTGVAQSLVTPSVYAHPIHAQPVVDLPGVHASADASCVEPAKAASAALSYSCLTRMMAADPVIAPPPGLDTDVSKRPSNTIGLYSASGLQNRMGPNLGISVHPYRPQVTYPSPLVPPAH